MCQDPREAHSTSEPLEQPARRNIYYSENKLP